MKEINKLNLGCGHQYIKGWVNLDLGRENNLGEKIKIDVNHDLGKLPYPFKDNTFDFILLNQVLEHLSEPQTVIKELKRICKNNAIIKIRVPHFSDLGAYEEPTHKHYYALNSIEFMKNGCVVKTKKLEMPHNILLKIIAKIVTISPFLYERFFKVIFPIKGILWELKVKK